MVNPGKVVAIGFGVLVAVSVALAKFVPVLKHLPLDTLVWLAALYALATPAVPWMFAPRGRQAVWASTVATLLILALLHALLWPACARCGQGAIFLVYWWGVAGMFGFVTLISAAFISMR